MHLQIMEVMVVQEQQQKSQDHQRLMLVVEVVVYITLEQLEREALVVVE